jgi:ATP-dependent Lon protease
MPRLLPLFPLQLVVFPGSAVPLHIFEDRYKEMVGEAMAAGTEFGIVMAKDGGIMNTGCTVLVESVVKQYPDGRMDIVGRGQRRFLIRSLDQEKEYLRGEVDYFNDDDSEIASPELRSQALMALQKMQEALALTAEHTGEHPVEAESPPDPDHPLLSFRLAENLDDLDFRNMLQRIRSETERLKAFAGFTDEYVARKQYTARMKRAAPQNGFGHKPVIH